MDSQIGGWKNIIEQEEFLGYKHSEKEWGDQVLEFVWAQRMFDYNGSYYSIWRWEKKPNKIVLTMRVGVWNEVWLARKNISLL